MYALNFAIKYKILICVSFRLNIEHFLIFCKDNDNNFIKKMKDYTKWFTFTKLNYRQMQEIIFHQRNKKEFSNNQFWKMLG